MPCLLPPLALRNRGGGERLAGDGLAGGPGLGSGSGEGEEEEGSPWGQFPVAARPEAVRGGLTMAAGGWRGAWGRRCKACRRPGPGGKGKGSLGGSIAYLGLGWGAAGRGVPRWPASWGGGNGERRRWELGRRLGAAVEVVEVKGDARAPFIGEIRRRGEPWGGGRVTVGRRAPRAPLMAIGAAEARFAAAQGRQEHSGSGERRAEHCGTGGRWRSGEARGRVERVLRARGAWAGR